MEDLRQQANDLLCYFSKMQNRLSQAGMPDANNLVTMFGQLQRGLEVVTLEELDPAIQEVNRLVESLTKMQADLQILKELKTRMAQLKNGSEPAARANGGAAAPGPGAPARR